jgi:hypothetical protein
MYDLALFSYEYYSKEIFEDKPLDRSEMIEITTSMFKIDQIE